MTNEPPGVYDNTGMADDEDEEHLKRTDRVPATVWEFPNGMLAVCDQFGKQMPEHQGEAREKAAPLRALIQANGWRVEWNDSRGVRTIERVQLLNVAPVRSPIDPACRVVSRVFPASEFGDTETVTVGPGTASMTKRGETLTAPEGTPDPDLPTNPTVTDGDFVRPGGEEP